MAGLPGTPDSAQVLKLCPPLLSLLLWHACAPVENAEAPPAPDCAKVMQPVVDELVDAAHARDRMPSTETGDAWKAAVLRLKALVADVGSRRTQTGEPSEFDQCVPRLAAFLDVSGQVFVEGHGLGMPVTDAEYFASTSVMSSVPTVFASPEFLEAASRDDGFESAKVLLRTLNERLPDEGKVLFFSFRSQHLGTPDNGGAMARLLVVVPGNPERWVQFGSGRPGEKVRNVSVVAVQTDSAGKKNTYFQDHYRTFQDDGSITLASRHDLGEGSAPCIHCHKSGVLPIFPEPGSVPSAEEAVLAQVNGRAVASMGSAFGGYWNPGASGPGLGAARVVRRDDAFFGRCVPPELLAARPDITTRLDSAMRCAGCHAEGALGALNHPFNTTLLRSYILSGRMPPVDAPPADERQALYQCLLLDFFDVQPDAPGVLKAWLSSKGPSQQDPQGANP